jgi:hypothetical protein
MASSPVLFATYLSRASALALLAGGVAFLFAADEILPRLVPGFPAAGTWLGQLIGAAWLGVATLNWLNRSLLLGGIYGRPIVATNALLYFVTAMVLVKAVHPSESPVGMWILVLPAVVLAALYSWLLYRGPFEHDLQASRRSQPQRS